MIPNDHARLGTQPTEMLTFTRVPLETLAKNVCYQRYVHPCSGETPEVETRSRRQVHRGKDTGKASHTFSGEVPPTDQNASHPGLVPR